MKNNIAKTLLLSGLFTVLGFAAHAQSNAGHSEKQDKAKMKEDIAQVQQDRAKHDEAKARIERDMKNKPMVQERKPLTPQTQTEPTKQKAAKAATKKTSK